MSRPRLFIAPLLITLTCALGAPAYAQEAAPANNRSASGLRTDMWTGPQSPLLELSGYVAAQSWELSYGGRDPNTTLGLTLGFLPFDWFKLVTVADFSLRRESPANLSVTNTNTYLAAGTGLQHWFGFVRLDLSGHAGGVIRTLAYSDDLGSSGNGTRLDPAVGFDGGVGLGLFGTAVLSFKSGARFYTDRTNVLFILDFGWFFGDRG